MVLGGLIAVATGYIQGRFQGDSILIRTALLNILYFLLFMAILNGVMNLIFIMIIGPFGTAIGLYWRKTGLYKSIWTPIALLLYFLILFFVGWKGMSSFSEATMWNNENKTAPDYTYPTPQRDTISSETNAGKVVVIDFWETWCAPCRRQLPILEKTYKYYKNNKKVSFLIVNPCKKDSFNSALQFIQKSNYDLPFAIDSNSIITERFRIQSLPTTLIIDKKGIIRYRHQGYTDSEKFFENISKKIDNLLNEK